MNVNKGKSMRLSYFGGTNNFLFNLENKSFQISPVVGTIRCLNVGKPGDVELFDVFPDLNRFKLESEMKINIKTVFYPNGIDVSWFAATTVRRSRF